MKLKFIFIVALLLFSHCIYSQNYNVEYYSVDAELSKEDMQKPEFGRYDGYKFPMNKGELATFIVYSEEFNPLLVLVTPEGKVFYQSKKHQSGLASFTSKIPISGEWVVYVLGNSNDEGKYLFQYGFANADAQVIPNDNEFCKTLEFLKAHSNAHFVFLEWIMGKSSPVIFRGAYDAYLNGDDASYNIVMYDGSDRSEAENVYKSLIDNIKKCSSDIIEIKQKNSPPIPEKEKSKLLQFNDDKSKTMEVSFYNYSNLDETEQKSFSVEFTIIKNKQ